MKLAKEWHIVNIQSLRYFDFVMQTFKSCRDVRVGYDNSAIFSALGRGTVGTVSVPAPLESEFQRRHAVWFHRK